MRISNNKKDLGKGAELLQMKDYNIKVKKKKRGLIRDKYRELINWKRDLNKIPRIQPE